MNFPIIFNIGDKLPTMDFVSYIKKNAAHKANVIDIFAYLYYTFEHPNNDTSDIYYSMVRYNDKSTYLDRKNLSFDNCVKLVKDRQKFRKEIEDHKVKRDMLRTTSLIIEKRLKIKFEFK